MADDNYVREGEDVDEEEVDETVSSIKTEEQLNDIHMKALS